MRGARSAAARFMTARFVEAGCWAVGVGLGWAPSTAIAQPQEAYSKSAEYRGMIEELHAAAPSPAYVATGRRPQADPRLTPEVQEDDSRLRIASAAARFTLDKAANTLTVDDLKSKARWTLAASCEGAAGGDRAAGAPADGSAGAVRATREGNSWKFPLRTACGGLSAQLDLLTDGLARLVLLPGGASASREISVHVDGGGPFFGLGERFWQAGLTGTSIDVRPQDRYGEPGHNWTYVAVPFVYGAGGLGLYLDTAFDTRFRFDEAGSSFDVKVANAPVPLYLFTEPTPKAVLRSYTAMTGRPQIPPVWTFGPWITALQGKGAVLDEAHRIRTEGMPASALWIYDQNDEASNLGWPFWFSSYYGDARTFVNTLHGQGFKVLTYMHPYVRQQILPYTTESAQFDKGVAQKLIAIGADGLPAGPRFELVETGNVDFTNPRAVDWWQGMVTSAVKDQGFDGWMEDFGEWVRDTDRFAAGDGRTISELYPLLYHKVTTRVSEALNPEVVSFSRSGSPGSQAFSPVLWGADQWPNWSRDYGLPSVVTAGITAGMSGFSTWGPDILSVGDSRELWARWVEFGALTPVMRDHVWNKPEHSYNVWSDAETTALFRQYATLHSSLLPYFVTYADEAQRTGIPIMRHTVLEYPDDPRSARAEYQYLLGKELLVAPVVQPGATLRTLSLPRGNWVNFWNGDNLTGGQDVTVVAETNQIPILVRAGSVLPFKPEAEAARWNWDDPQLLTSSLVWRAYLSIALAADSTFTMPNGTSAHFEQKGDAVSVDGKSRTVRDYEVILRTKQPPHDVRLNGSSFAEFSKDAAGHPASQWWWNPSTFEVHMIFRAADFRLEMKGTTPTQYQ